MASTYPLTLSFDHRSSDHRFTITNARGQTMVEGQEFLIQSKIELVAYQNRGQRRYIMEAPLRFWLNSPFHIWDERDRLMTDRRSKTLGTVQRQHWWNNCYQIYDAQQHIAFSFKSENNNKAWGGLIFFLVFIMGCLLNGRSLSPNISIPGVCLMGFAFLGFGLLNSGYLCNSAYWVQRANGRRVMQFIKRPSSNGNSSSFTIRAIDTVSDKEEMAILCGIILVTLRHGEKQSD
jgi:hypothetical protein